MLKNIDFSNSPGFIEILNVKDIPLNYSKCIQIILVLDGEVNLFLSLKNYKLTKGDVHYIHYDDINGMEASCDNKVLFIYINPDFADSLHPDIIYDAISTNIKNSKGYIQDAKKSLDIQIASSAISYFENYNSFPEELEKLIDIIYFHFRSIYVDLEDGFSYKKIQNIAHAELINKIVSRIYKKSNEKLSLTEFSNIYSISRDHLSHRFSQCTGLNFRDFVSMVRVEKSILPLLTTNDSIEKISNDSGFSHSSFYKKSFIKWCKLSPTDFREKYQNWIYSYHNQDYDSLPYNQVSSDIHSFLFSSGITTSSDFLTTIDINELEFKNHIHINPIELNEHEVMCDDFCDLTNYTKDFFTSKLSLSANDLSFPKVIISNTPSCPNSTYNKPERLEDLLDILKNPLPINLYSTHSNLGLYNSKGSKSMLFYFYVWLLCIPKNSSMVSQGIIGKAPNCTCVLISNLDYTHYNQITLYGNKTNSYIASHYSLSEQTFEKSKFLKNKNLSLYQLEKSCEPSLDITYISSSTTEMKITLPPRSISYVVLVKE